MEISERDGNTRPPDLPLENLYASQEMTVRTGHGTTDWFQTGKGIKIARRNINNLKYTDDTILMAESEEELKILLMKVKQESEKDCLKVNIQKTKIMASGPITSWEIDGDTVETVSDFVFWAAKSLQMVMATMKFKDTYSLEEKL